MVEKDVYTELAEKLGAPVSERFLALLREMFTPEEANVCLELYIPGTVQDLKEALGFDEAALTKILDNLVDRGLLTRGKTQFAFTTSLHGLYVLSGCGVHTGPNALSQKGKDLWADFFYNEWSEINNKQASERKAAGEPGRKAIPAIGALEISNIADDDLLPQENWKMGIKLAKRRIIGACACRILWGKDKCDHPLMTCFGGFDTPTGIYFLDKPGRLWKEYTEEETFEIVRQIEEAGLVHIGICNCCDDACIMLYPYTKYNRLDLIDPNRFQAAVDQETCVGCQDCVERCIFNAIDMVKVPGSKKLKASIITENCKGCGLCVVGCKEKALKLEIVRPKEYIKPRGEVKPTELEPSKSGRRIPVNATVTPGGLFFDLE